MESIFLAILSICGIALVIVLTLTAIFAILRYALLPLGMQILYFLGLD